MSTKISNKLPEEALVTEPELKQSSYASQPETQSETENGSQVDPNAGETITKLEEAEQEQTEETKTEEEQTEETKTGEEVIPEVNRVIHVLEYTGHGAWVDQEGNTWSRKSTNKNIISTEQMTDEEYATRSDIHFMVKYGEMSHTVVNV